MIDFPIFPLVVSRMEIQSFKNTECPGRFMFQQIADCGLPLAIRPLSLGHGLFTKIFSLNIIPEIRYGLFRHLQGLFASHAVQFST